MSIEEVYHYPEYYVVCDFCGHTSPVVKSHMAASSQAKEEGFRVESWQKGLDTVSRWACANASCQNELTRVCAATALPRKETP